MDMFYFEQVALQLLQTCFNPNYEQARICLGTVLYPLRSVLIGLDITYVHEKGPNFR